METPSVRPVYFGIVALPVLCFVLHRFLVLDLGVPVLPLGAEIVAPDRAHLEAPGRARFLAAFWIFTLVVLVSVTLLADALRQPMTRLTRACGLIAMAAVMVPLLLSVIEHQQDADAWRAYHQLGPAVFEAALGQGVVAACPVPEARWMLGPCGDAPALDILRDVLDVVNLLSALGVGAIAVSMVLCLKVLPPGAPVDRQVDLLRHNRAQMRKLTYISGVLLSSGMVLALVWMHWPLPLILEDRRWEFEAVLRGVEFLTGVYFSMLTLSFYLPVAFVMDLRVRRLAEAEADPSAQRKWKEERGLDFDQLQLIKEGLAVAAPVLAAFAGGFSPLP